MKFLKWFFCLLLLVGLSFPVVDYDLQEKIPILTKSPVNLFGSIADASSRRRRVLYMQRRRRLVPAGGATEGTDITDDFSSDSGWNDDQGTWTYQAGTDDVDSDRIDPYRCQRRHDTSISHATNQWAKVKLTDIDLESGVMFHTPTSGSANILVVRIDDAGEFAPTALSFDDGVTTWAFLCSTAEKDAGDIADGNVIAVAITGTGAALKIYAWINPDVGGDNTPDDWGAADVSWTGSGDCDNETIDTSAKTGMYSRSSDGSTFDDFSAGWWTP